MKAFRNRPRRLDRNHFLAVEGLESRQLLTFGVTQYPLSLSSFSTQGIATGSDGNLWISEPNVDAIGMFDVTTHLETSFSLPLGSSHPTQIVPGPDGNLWFADLNPFPSFASINPSTHVVTQYQTGYTGSSSFGGIAFDGNGKLWATIGCSDVARFDPVTSSFTQFATPTSNSLPTGITTGPGGSIWFTENSANQIATINTITDAITEYPITGTGPGVVTLGPDGNFWYTLVSPTNSSSASAGAIGTFNAATHASSAYATSSPPLAVASGPGNSLTFVQSNQNLGVIDASSKAISQVATPGGSPSGFPISVTTGPDGNAWYLKFQNPGGSIGSVNSAATDTQTSLTAAPNPVTSGQNVTFTATVAPLSGSSVPTGIVTFLDGTTILSTSTLDASGVATFTTSTLSAGTHPITVQYYGDANFGQSVSAVVNQTVNLIGTTTTLVATPSTTTWGNAVTLTANVVDANGDPIRLGTVYFYIKGNVPEQGLVANVLNGVGSYKIDLLDGGSYQWLAKFEPQGDLAGSTSNIANVVIQPIPTTLSLTSNVDSQLTGQPVDFTATLSDAGSIFDANGSLVTFYDGSQAIGTANVYTNVASFGISSLPAGPHIISAVFSGNPNLITSTSNSVLLQITQAPPVATTLTLSSSNNPQNTGQPVTFTATLGFSSALHPTASIGFYDGSTLIGTAPIINDSASLTVPQLSAGTHLIKAVYVGDVNFAPSTSNTLSQVINQVAATTTSIYFTPNPIPFNSPYSLTITVKPSVQSKHNASLTGVVSVYFQSSNFTQSLGNFKLDSAGQVTLSYASPSPYLTGLVTFTAIYSGDAHYNTSTSVPSYATFSLPDGPLVTLITTAGSHSSTKTLVVHVNEALDAITSQNVNNYKIATANGRSRINVKQAVFNPLDDTVTLSLRSAVPINGRYSLTIVGTGQQGVTDSFGRLLDGHFKGIPGSNFSTPLTFKNRFVAPRVPAKPKVAHKH